ncbi:hypothetical protein [Flavobacterium silvaticum]|uniref:Uncharacterized protein n=1 Tax=Flavobacterium silvaticum TaxID=1852020 RepID=A0A972JHI4_9FLAO|nr:hypothetical protein [Flavobacterium silvaticum]NMH27163.1 hypothetical protein [Flavobacterium silvaticum]
MTYQYILFMIVIAIGAGYARKYGRKAQEDIRKYEENKTSDDTKKERLPDDPERRSK